MSPAPAKIGGATVIYYTPIDGRHRHTGACRQVVAGVLQGGAAGLAICRYEGDDCYYLFGCDEKWESVTDTWHETLDDAKREAEFEYEGVTSTWARPALSGSTAAD